MIDDEIMEALDWLYGKCAGEDFARGVRSAMSMLGDLDTWEWEDMTDDEKDAFVRRYI